MTTVTPGAGSFVSGHHRRPSRVLKQMNAALIERAPRAVPIVLATLSVVLSTAADCR